MTLAVIVIVSSVVATAAIRFYWGRSGRLPKVVAPGSLILLAFCLAGLYMIFMQSMSLESLLEQKEWPSVEGQVVSSEIVGERAISPRLVYEYTINGVTYEGVSSLEAPMFGGKRKKYDVARELSSHFVQGDSITVFYSPVDPSESTVTPWPSWDVYGRLSVGVLLFMAGLLGIMLPVRKRATR